MTPATPILVAHYAEIALKGRNRPMFLRRLLKNIRAMLADEPVASIEHVESRVLVRLSDPSRAEAAAQRLRRVFGIEWLAAAEALPRDEVGDDLGGLSRLAASLARRDLGDARHFKIQARRSDRSFPLISPEIERIVGAAVQAELRLPVRLAQPDLTVHILVMRDAILVTTGRIQGHGGLPLGTGGKVAALLSGGIDSPVAAWLLMRRGCRAELIHFYSGRDPREAAAEKIEKLAGILAGYSPGPLGLRLVPSYPYELRAVAGVEGRWDMLLFRRYMLKTAAALARRAGCLGLVTGDSLGQVASQTLPNMAAIGPDVQLPVFRPLIGMDKREITNLAARIGTYETSILPYRDCCSIRSPRPVLNATAAELLRHSDEMDLDGAVQEACRAAERRLVLPDGTVRRPEPATDPDAPAPAAAPEAPPPLDPPGGVP